MLSLLEHFCQAVDSTTQPLSVGHCSEDSGKNGGLWESLNEK